MRTLFFAFSALLLAACGDNTAAETSGATATATAQASQPTQADDPAARGRREFNQCAICHSVREGEASRVGPNLFGVYGRAAGALDDFAYSAALRDSDVVWDDASLDAFMENPRAFMPGNRMAYMGENDAAAREDLIAFLKTLTTEEN